MKCSLFIVSILLMAAATSCQSNKQQTNYNLGFEKVADKQPVEWPTFGSTDYLFAVKQTIEGIKNGKDEVLDRAIEIIDTIN